MRSQLLNHSNTRTVEQYSHALPDEVYEARLQQRAWLEKYLGGSSLKPITLVLAALLVGGCALETSIFYGDSPANADFTRCRRENLGVGMIPDFGVTYNRHMEQCMREAGWEKLPPPVPEGPSSYRKIS